MKKTNFLLVLLFTSLFGFSQFTETTYRGAFAPAPEAMWTDSWTNFNPQTTVYPTTFTDVTSNIITNTTWTTGTTYKITGLIYITDNATLTIEPGVVILGNNAATALIVTKGAKLIANGTVTSPIVFTSDKAPGLRSRGDWGGVILLGKGTYNVNAGIGNIEGITGTINSQFGGGTTPDNADSSGSLKYVRIEYGGFSFAPNSEINGLTMGAVGSGTTIDYIQVSFCNDDSFEWFGGSVNCSHLVAYRGLDDDFDTDNGYNGKVQFALAIKEPQAADASQSNCFEADNAAGTGNAFVTATPISKPIFSNCTLVGPVKRSTLPNGGAVANLHRRAVHARRNTQMKIYNSLFVDFVDGIVVENDLTIANAESNTMKFRNNIIAGTVAAKVATVPLLPVGSTFNVGTWFTDNNNNSLPNTSRTTNTLNSSSILPNIYNLLDGSDYSTMDFRPAGVALSGADFTDTDIAAVTTTTLGTNDFNVADETNKFNVYPNSFANTFKLSFSTTSTENATLSVYTIDGKLVENRTVSASEINNVELGSSYATGVYVVNIKQGQNLKATRAIKQ
jgi:Secretion system C-terminal sorting domain